MGSIAMNNISMRRAFSGSVLQTLADSKQDYNRTFLNKKILDQQVELIQDDDISPQLKNSDGYVYRHIGNSEVSTQRALDFLGVSSMEELMK